MDGHCGANPTLGGRVLIRLKVINSGWSQQRVESLKLTKADVEVWIDEDIGWANGAVRAATSVQPGYGGC